MIARPVLPNLIRHHACLTPQALAIRTRDGHESTYATFDHDINALAWRLQPFVKPGDIVGLTIGDEYLSWVSFIALARLGVASFSDLSPSAAKDELVQPACKLTDGDEESTTGVPLHRLDRSFLEGAPATSLALPQLGPDWPARLIFTSGTTGRNKAVMLTHGMLDARLPRYIASYGMGSAPQAASFIEPSASPGMSIAMAAWAQGGTLLRYDYREFAEVMKIQSVGFLMASPMNLRVLLSHLPRDNKPSPGLRILVVGGVLQPSVARALTLHVASDILIRYGATEASSVTSGPATLQERQLGTAGSIIEGSSLEIVDAEGAPRSAGEKGEVRMRAPGMAQGYFRNPQESQSHFKDGWFYPGDQGSLSTEGILRVEGRSGDALNIGGIKLSSAVVDNELIQLEGVEDAGACVLYDRAGAAVLVAGVVLRDDVKLREVEREAGKKFPIPIKLTALRMLPRTETGKMQQDLLGLRLASLSKGSLRNSLIGTGFRGPPARRRS